MTGPLRVATHLAHWISPRFAVHISKWIEECRAIGNNNAKYLSELSNLQPSWSDQLEKKNPEIWQRSLNLKWKYRRQLVELIY